MIILDTNVISEFVRARPEPAVVTWLDRQDFSELWITAVTAAELGFGTARLPPGKRRDMLSQALETALNHTFAGRVLPFDASAARTFGPLAAACEAQGRPIGTADGQIAAICLTLDSDLATRNVRDFAPTGIRIIDPWNP